MKEAGILPSFAGIAVSDRYRNCYSATWENLAGNQACAAHLIRDFADCAEPARRVAARALHQS